MVRVRFAPSPTGEPHVGSAWAALFNWLFAKHYRGNFILRIEDTDRARTVPGAVDRIYEMLDWLGLTPDEGPREGGPHAPYVQSERLEHYRKAAERLRQTTAAYRCFCSPERLERLRAEQQGRGEAPRYDRRCRTISPSESAARATSVPFVIRLAIPDGETIAHDIVRGKVRWDNATLDDSVLLKSDRYPTYHLANVVDDHAMEITHVIRAEEWLPSLPKHLILYAAFGWKPPTFAHLPLILGPDRKKLSKRHGHVAALEYRSDYLPEAFINFLVLMGWRPPKSNDEIFTRDKLIQLFDLGDVRKSGAIFDIQKLRWLNREWLKLILAEQSYDLLGDATLTPQEIRFWPLAIERAETIQEVKRLARQLARPDPVVPPLLIPKGGTPAESRRVLEVTAKRLEGSQSWNADHVKQALAAVEEETGVEKSHVQWVFRIALAHTNPSPSGIELAATLGREETLRRISEAIAVL